MSSVPNTGRHAEPPFWLALAAGLPIGACMIVLALPGIGFGHGTAYRTLYLVMFALWALPLTTLQRVLWRRRVPGLVTVVTLLVVTYAMSVANNALGDVLAYVAGWPREDLFRWSAMFRGIDSCWLALVAFCAIHGVVAYYAALQHERERHADARLLARDAELRALRYQLQPHFLFNTLNAISSLVAAERNREARQMITRLGEFLRATLEANDAHETSLGEELALTETYLDIEKARLGDRLRVQWNIGPDVLRALVPHLLLQPLVENAIRHGIAQRKRPGRLDIAIARDGGRLVVTVGNDGAVPGSVHAGTAERSSALGLRNVAERLAKLHPDDHAFTADARADGGYDVRIDLPWRESAGATATVP